MIHLYECLNEFSGEDYRYWEVYKAHPYESWEDQFVRDIDHEELELLLDNYRAQGLDFVLHTLEDYDEYHLALPSV
jgi:hypothetical protein